MGFYHLYNPCQYQLDFCTFSSWADTYGICSRHSLYSAPCAPGPPAFGTAVGTTQGTPPASDFSSAESLLSGLGAHSPVPAGAQCVQGHPEGLRASIPGDPRPQGRGVSGQPFQFPPSGPISHGHATWFLRGPGRGPPSPQ